MARRADPEIAQAIGTNLRRARKAAGLSQEALGFAAELHPTEVGVLERGLRVPRADTMVRLAGALGVDAGALLAGIDWRSGRYVVGGFVLPTEAREGGEG